MSAKRLPFVVAIATVALGLPLAARALSPAPDNAPIHCAPDPDTGALHCIPATCYVWPDNPVAICRAPFQVVIPLVSTPDYDYGLLLPQLGGP